MQGGTARRGSGGALVVGSGSAVTLTRCALVNNQGNYGGAVSANGGLVAVDTTFDGNTGSYGGAIIGWLFPSFSLVNLTRCAVTNNTSSNSRGGGVQMAAPSYGGNGFLVVADSVFSDNVAYTVSGGGAIAGDAMNVSGSVFRGNTAVRGGALSAWSESSGQAAASNWVRIADSLFEGNSASVELAGAVSAGGALLVYTTNTVELSGVVFRNNSAAMGGAVAMLGGGLSVAGGVFDGNTASGADAQGGALHLDDGSMEFNTPTLQLNSVLLTGNAANVETPALAPGESYTMSFGSGRGGGAYVAAWSADAGATIQLVNTTVVGCNATQGGGMFLYGNVALDASGGALSGNTALDDGGALALMSSTPLDAVGVMLSRMLCSDNSAATGGAVSISSGSSLTAANTTFSSNAATNGAVFALQVAGLSAAAPVLTLRNVTATGNTAVVSGGLFYTDSLSPVASPSCVDGGVCTGNVALNGADTLVAPPLAFNVSAASLSTKSGALLPPFRVSLYDALGNLVLEAPDLTVTVASSVASTDGIRGLSGASTVPYSGGAATFDLLRLVDTPGDSSVLTFALHSASLTLIDGRSGALAVEFAACSATEAFDSASQTCKCIAGTYLQDGECVLCGAGFFTEATNTAAACSQCPAGYVSSADRTACSACPAGSFLNASSLLCQTCARGSYSPTAGQVACLVNPAGFTSSTQTTFTGNLTLAGIAAAAFGAAQNATVAASIAGALDVTASAVVVTSVGEVAARRLLLQASSAVVGFYVRTTDDDTATSLRSALGASATFAGALAAALRASGDPVLAAVSSVAAAAATETALVLDALPCPKGTYLDGLTQDCEACPHGLVSTSIGSTLCEACPASTAAVDSAHCVACPANAITNPNDAGECACQSGYYDTRFGANATAPVCAACPRGGVCTTGSVGAAKGYWRESLSSAVFYACRTGKCLQENVTGPLNTVSSGTRRRLSAADGVPTNCVEGNTGPLCGVCLPGYAMQSGECAPCEPSDAFTAWSIGSRVGLVVGCVACALIVITFAVYQPLLPPLERFVTATLAVAAAAPARIKACLSCAWRKQEQPDGLEHRPSVIRSAALPKRSSAADAAHHAALQHQAAAGIASGAGLAAGVATASALSHDSGDAEHRQAARAESPEDHEEDVISGELDLMDQVEEVMDTLDSLPAAIEQAIAKLKSISKIVVNYYQITSTFLRSLDVPWPAIFGTVMTRVNVINLNLVQLPKTACLTPNPPFYEEFNGYTLGLVAALLAVAGLWALGVRVIAPWSLRALSEEERSERIAAFNSTLLSRSLLLLYLVYPGVSVAIFSMFSCTTFASGSSWLNADFSLSCSGPLYAQYFGAAIAWILIVPVGVPAFFIWLLYRFKVPQMAALRADNAWLREAVTLAFLDGVAQPVVPAAQLNVDDISDVHLEVLYAHLVRNATAEESAGILAGTTPPLPAPEEEPEPEGRVKRLVARAKAAREALKQYIVGKRGRASRAAIPAQQSPEALRRAFVLDQILGWCKTCGRCALPPLCWQDEPAPETAEPETAVALAKLDLLPRTNSAVPPAGGPVLSQDLPALQEQATMQVGFLFSAYHAGCWYWESVELGRKLLLASILALIAPGSAGQVVVGIILAFATLLLNLRLRPFADESLNFVSAIAQLNLFFVLFVALLLKVNLDGDSSKSFFAYIVGLLCGIPVVLPIVVKLYMNMFGKLESRVIIKEAQFKL